MRDAETRDDYGAVLVIVGDRLRLIRSRAGLQLIGQRRVGANWRGFHFFRTTAGARRLGDWLNVDRLVAAGWTRGQAERDLATMATEGENRLGCVLGGRSGSMEGAAVRGLAGSAVAGLSGVAGGEGR